jgi:hypothetical protein
MQLAPVGLFLRPGAIEEMLGLQRHGDPENILPFASQSEAERVQQYMAADVPRDVEYEVRHPRQELGGMSMEQLFGPPASPPPAPFNRYGFASAPVLERNDGRSIAPLILDRLNNMRQATVSSMINDNSNAGRFMSIPVSSASPHMEEIFQRYREAIGAQPRPAVRESPQLLFQDSLPFLHTEHPDPELDELRTGFLYAGCMNEISDIQRTLVEKIRHPRLNTDNQPDPDVEFCTKLSSAISAYIMIPAGQHRPMINPAYACCDVMREKIEEFNQRGELEFHIQFVWDHGEHDPCGIIHDMNGETYIANINHWRKCIFSLYATGRQRYVFLLDYQEHLEIAYTSMLSGSIARLGDDPNMRPNPTIPKPQWISESAICITYTTKFPCSDKPILDAYKEKWPLYSGYNGQDLCIICASNCVDVGFKPCGHASTCADCCNQLLKTKRYICTLCNGQISTMTYLRPEKLS